MKHYASGVGGRGAHFAYFIAGCILSLGPSHTGMTIYCPYCRSSAELPPLALLFKGQGRGAGEEKLFRFSPLRESFSSGAFLNPHKALLIVFSELVQSAKAGFGADIYYPGEVDLSLGCNSAQTRRCDEKLDTRFRMHKLGSR